MKSISFWERLIIIDESGIILYSDPQVNGDNMLLIGGFFQAIESLFRTEFDDQLRELKGVKYHASIIQKQVKSNNILFMGLTSSETCENKRRKELEFVAIQFIKHFHPLINKYINEPYRFDDFRDIPKTRKDAALIQISDNLQLNPKLTSKKKKVKIFSLDFNTKEKKKKGYLFFKSHFISQEQANHEDHRNK